MQQLPRQTLLAAAFSASLCGVAQAATAQDALGDWYRYALHQLSPDISVSLGVTTPSDGNAVLVRQRSLLPLGERAGWLSSAFEGSQVSISIERSAGRTAPQPGGRNLDAFPQPGDVLRRTTAPELTAAFGRGSQVRVGAVFAQQQFLSGLGERQVDVYNPLSRAVVQAEQTSGSAIRVGFDQALGDALALQLDYQSRVDMDAFQRLRGLYTEPGDFDVPATVSMGLNVASSARTSVGIGVDRLLYSDVPAFTSNALPNRLLSLLGDSTSPSFEWRDLTVYRAQVSFKPAEASALSLSYATRLQPLPTSVALSQALAQNAASRNVAVGFDQNLSTGGAFSVAASYAPSQYFLGPRVGENDNDGALLELQAVWRFEF
jgi:hypothetical protein